VKLLDPTKGKILFELFTVICILLVLWFNEKCIYRKRTDDDAGPSKADDAGPSKGNKKKASKKKTTSKKKKNTVEEEAEEGCCCSSSKGCEKLDGHVLWRTLRLMVHFQIFCDLCFVI